MAKSTAFAATGLVSWAGAAVLFIGAASGAGAASANEGDALFAARCGDCHGAREIAHWGTRRPDAAERRAWLEGFLERHYAPREDERRLIIDYIERTIAQE